MILTGCTGIQYGKTKEQAALADDAHTGVKGITVNFIKNNPPDIAFSGSPIDISLEVKNEGAATASGTLYLTGFDSQIFNFGRPEKQFTNLEGRTKFNTLGGYEVVSFSSANVDLPKGTDTLDQNFLASVCYRYRTEARIPVCIDPNPTSVLENEACKVTNPAVAGGQGAPVAVSAVREDAMPGKVSFYLTISNLGDGFVVDTASLAKCPNQLKFNDVDSVDYSVQMSGATGSCKPDGKVKMANKQGTLYCTFTLTDSISPAFTSVLEVNLDYAYLSQKTKSVKVKSIS